MMEQCFILNMHACTCVCLFVSICVCVFVCLFVMVCVSVCAVSTYDLRMPANYAYLP